jgi:hypothetical protein
VSTVDNPFESFYINGLSVGVRDLLGIGSTGHVTLAGIDGLDALSPLPIPAVGAANDDFEPFRDIQIIRNAAACLTGAAWRSARFGPSLNIQAPHRSFPKADTGATLDIWFLQHYAIGSGFFRRKRRVKNVMFVSH